MVFVGNVNPEDRYTYLSQPQGERHDIRAFRIKINTLMEQFQVTCDQLNERMKSIECLSKSSSAEYLYEMVQVDDLGNRFNQIVLDLNFGWAGIHPPIPSFLSLTVSILRTNSLAKYAECKALSDQLDQLSYVIIEKKIKEEAQVMAESETSSDSHRN